MKYKTNDTIPIRMIDFLSKEFPVPCLDKTNKYEVGTILSTKVRFRTNATILEVEHNAYAIVTDIGNILIITEKELKEWYKSPREKRLKYFLTERQKNCLHVWDDNTFPDICIKCSLPFKHA